MLGWCNEASTTSTMGFRNVEGSACWTTDCPWGTVGGEVGTAEEESTRVPVPLLFSLGRFMFWTLSTLGAEVMRPFTDHQERSSFFSPACYALFFVCVSPPPFLLFQLAFSWLWRVHSSEPKRLWHHRGYRGSGGWYTTGCRGAGAFWQTRWGSGRPFRYYLPRRMSVVCRCVCCVLVR